MGLFFADQDPVKYIRVVGANIMPELKGQGYLQFHNWEKMRMLDMSQVNKAIHLEEVSGNKV